MRIGYPCINRTIGCTANSTFRLKKYSEANLIQKVENNLDCLKKILEFNAKNKIFFFRISSDIIPFASHPINTFNWKSHFKEKLEDIGRFIQNKNMRISMHPDQFVVINSLDKKIVDKSISDLKWHCELLDSMGLDETAKVQIHVGGVYGDKEKAIKRFITVYNKLPSVIKKRLAIENDDRSYSLADCLEVNKKCGIPVIFDSFHHECLNNGESLQEALEKANKTWKKGDGDLMVDYSSQKPKARSGSHVDTLDEKHFKKFLDKARALDPDIMLEIKDKEKSVINAIRIIGDKI
jgi:UV DNA damage endonuclease